MQDPEHISFVEYMLILRIVIGNVYQVLSGANYGAESLLHRCYLI